jgi:hypothetical protein
MSEQKLLCDDGKGFENRTCHKMCQRLRDSELGISALQEPENDSRIFGCMLMMFITEMLSRN